MTDWKNIVDQHGPLVWSTVYRLVDNYADAYDCYQETFFEAYKVAERETVRDWRGLLRRLATVRAIKSLQLRGRLTHRIDGMADAEDIADPVGEPPRRAESNELAEHLRLALLQLPQQQAEVFCLNCLEHFSYEEIAEQLHVTVNAVGVLLHRAKQKLRDLLIQFDINADSKN
jgi:RNA polymerase sigma-70 factor, ECF subfamily